MSIKNQHFNDVSFKIFGMAVRKIVTISCIYCTVPQCWPLGQNFGDFSIFNPTFIGFRETSSYWSVQFVNFFSAFQSTNLVWIRYPKSDEDSLATINRQTSYDSGIFRQNYGIIRGLLMNHTGHLNRNGRALLQHWTGFCGPWIAAIAGPICSKHR